MKRNKWVVVEDLVDIRHGVLNGEHYPDIMILNALNRPGKYLCRTTKDHTLASSSLGLGVDCLAESRYGWGPDGPFYVMWYFDITDVRDKFIKTQKSEMVLQWKSKFNLFDRFDQTSKGKREAIFVLSYLSMIDMLPDPVTKLNMTLQAMDYTHWEIPSDDLWKNMNSTFEKMVNIARVRGENTND